MKKTLAILLCLVMLLSFCTACGPKEDPNQKNPDINDKGEVYSGAMVENGNTYADSNWLPVVKTPITVEACVRVENDIGDWYARSIWDEIANTTGVRFDIQVIELNETETLMFASRNYPDCTFRIYNTAFAYDEAKTMGDMVELTDEMLATYAPNWYRIFEEYPELYAQCLHSDGKLYNLPNIQMQEDTYKLRDLCVINAAWLDELGLDVPTTTDEYLDFLRAVKNAAGTGSIPENVIPLCMRAHVEIGSYYTLMDFFGVYQGFAYEIIDNGVVKHNAQNEMIKPAVKYLNQLWSEGLLNSDFFSINWDEFNAKVYTDTDNGAPTVASYFAYEMAGDDYVCFAPLQAIDGVTPTVHDFGFESRVIPIAFGIFATSKYPIAILRAIDHYASGEAAVRLRIGEEGEDAQWVRDEDGYPVLNENSWEPSVDISKKGGNDYVPCVVTPEYCEHLYAKEAEGNTRTHWYYELYQDAIPAGKQKFPTTILSYLSAEEQSQVNQTLTMVNSQVKKYMNKWIKGETSIDDDWDDFQSALVKAGLNDRLALMQKAYDLYVEGQIG